MQKSLKNTANIIEVDYTNVIAAGKKTITITLPKISRYLRTESLTFCIYGLSRNNNLGYSLIINCDPSDGIESSASKSLTLTNIAFPQKYTLSHDGNMLWRNISVNESSPFGLGKISTSVPDGSDLLEFFKTAPTGFYRMDGVTNAKYINTLGLPYTNKWYDVIVSAHEQTSFRSLIVVGSDGSVMSGSIINNGWTGFTSTGVPAGTPIPYPGVTPPDGYLLLNGGSFDKSQFPMLAQLFTSGILPDLRGEFIRGWDNARGVDSGRAVLSSQLDGAPNITGEFGRSVTLAKGALYETTNFVTGAFEGKGLTTDYINLSAMPTPTIGSGANYPSWFSLSASKSNAAYGRSSEIRPRNVAFNYIVRAL